MKKFVYLISCVDIYGFNTYKIGISNNIEKRIVCLQTGNSNKITFHSSYKTSNYNKVEKWMHRKYKSQVTESNNEWRKLTDEQVFSFINDCKEADETIEFLLENNSLFE